MTSEILVNNENNLCYTNWECKVYACDLKLGILSKNLHTQYFGLSYVTEKKSSKVGEMCSERWYLPALSGSWIQAPGFAGGTVTFRLQRLFLLACCNRLWNNRFGQKKWERIFSGNYDRNGFWCCCNNLGSIMRLDSFFKQKEGVLVPICDGRDTVNGASTHMCRGL